MPTVQESRAYSRGYQAGIKRVKREINAANIKKQRNAIWRRCFMQVLNFSFTQSTWKCGNKPINTISERTDLAADIADAALKEIINRGRE